MLKYLLSTIVTTMTIMSVTAQEKTPRLGIDPIQKVVNNMTLDEKPSIFKRCVKITQPC